MIAALDAGTERRFEPNAFRKVLLRPYVERIAYFGSGLVEMPYKMPAFFPEGDTNVAIFFNDPGARTQFSPLASTLAGEYHLAASYDGFQAVPRYRFVANEGKTDNITDWALRQFKNKYEFGLARPRKANSPRVTKEAIFFYVYAALHDPVYRQKYAQNLKREFPRIPLHEDFWKWAAWGEQLLRLHTDFNDAQPWKLRRVDVPDKAARAAGISPKPILKPNIEKNEIIIDTETSLEGIPPSAWLYRLGSRSALEWVLDQHKEKSGRDEVVRDNFERYTFAEHKERVIDLLRKVTKVSVETMTILDELEKVSRIELA